MMNQLIESSHQRYSPETIRNFTSYLETSVKKQTRQSTTIPTGSYVLGDLTYYDENCVQQIAPFTQMMLSPTYISVSHQIIGLSFYIQTILRRPLSTLYNAVLSYNGNSVPICFNVKDGEIAFTSDFLLCSSVESYAPTCKKSTTVGVYNVAMVYKSPGSQSQGILAGIIVGGVVILASVILCCIGCIACCIKAA